MLRKLVLCLALLLVSAALGMAQEQGARESGDPEAKLVTGMSILGNDEAPKSLFIVPWKSSEMGVETSLSRTLNEHDEPVDREVLLRELDFYQISVGSEPSAGSHSQSH
jgi:hypothetical protein